MALHLILWVILTCALIWGIHAVTREGFLLDGLGNRLRRLFTDTFVIPLFDCPVCMASVWGTITFWLGVIHGLPAIRWDSVAWWAGAITLWAAYMLMIAGVNFIVLTILRGKDDIS